MRILMLIAVGLMVGIEPFGQQKKTTAERNKPPIIKTFTSSIRTISHCAFSPSACSDVDRKVRLNTTVEDSEKPFTYSYAVSAGKIVGEGPDVIWDLTDVGIGEYTATVSVKKVPLTLRVGSITSLTIHNL